MSAKSEIAKIKYHGITLEVDPDQNWLDLKSLPIEDQRNQVLTDLHFLIHLGTIDLPYSIKTRFFDYFTKPECNHSREVAKWGIVESNYSNEAHLVESALKFSHDRKSGKIQSQDAFFRSTASLALEITEIIEKRDVAALRRIISIIENKGIPEGSRGGVGSEDGYMLEKFCDLHLATRSLPTKKALRDACGLGAREDEKMASKRMDKLGLKGLPTEPEI